MPIRLIKYITDTIIIVVITAVVLEILSFVLSKAKILPFYQTPQLYLSNTSTGVSWRNENSAWGAWHKKNYADRHGSECFNVLYKSNEVGARDDAFNGHMPYKKNYVLLGDSFAEGYGISKEQTSERLIENKLGVNILNFGAGGNLGPLQYFLLYERLASQYSHDGVIIYFLPDNDFNDNDYVFWQAYGMDRFANGAERYRPYYQKTEAGEYSYFYPKNAEPTDYFDRSPSSLRSFIANNFWSANVVRTVRMAFSKENPYQIALRSGKPYAGYFDAPREQQEATLYFLNKIFEKSGNKNVLLVIIPTESDFARIISGEKPEAQYWYQHVKRLQQRHRNLAVIDLVSYSPKNIKDLYLSCDGHWSSVGNKWAADIISNAVVKSFH